jgi:hypothetical protein
VKSPAGATGAQIDSLTPSFGASSGDEALAQRYSPIALRAVAVPVASGTSPAPAQYRIDVTSLNRAFFLGGDFLPQASFAQWRGSATLTPAQPTAVIWQR